MKKKKKKAKANKVLTPRAWKDAEKLLSTVQFQDDYVRYPSAAVHRAYMRLLLAQDPNRRGRIVDGKCILCDD